MKATILRAAILGGCLLQPACAALAGDEQSATQPPDAKPAGWQELFQPNSLEGWAIVNEGEFAQHGKVRIEDGLLTLEAGRGATGIRRQAPFPTNDFEISFEAKRVAGGDFFCGLTFPVQDGSLTLILGGWGGWMSGLSCLDGVYAVDNETGVVVKFKNDTWYRIRLKVTQSSIDAFVDDQHFVELDPSLYKLTVSREMRPCMPLGFATWNTTGAMRKLRYRALPGERP